MSKPSEQSCRIERLDEKRLQHLTHLHRAVYGKAEDGYYSKKYNTAYTGLQYVGYIAYNDENIPIAFYGVLPCFLQYQNQIFLSAQSADTMTHPVHRYKGLFVELSRLTFDLCRQLGIRILFGFPNQNSYHGAVEKLGWIMTHALDYFKIPVKTFPLEQTAGRLALSGKIYISYISYLLGKKAVHAKGVPNSSLTGLFAGVNRSTEFLHYKSYSPSYVLQVGDAKVWLRIRNGLRIGDIQNVNGENFEAVIDALKKFASRAGIRDIAFHCSPGTALHKLFSQYYPAVPSFPVLFQDFGTPVPLEKIKFTYADLDIF